MAHYFHIFKMVSEEEKVGREVITLTGEPFIGGDLLPLKNAEFPHKSFHI